MLFRSDGGGCALPHGGAKFLIPVGHDDPRTAPPPGLGSLRGASGFKFSYFPRFSRCDSGRPRGAGRAHQMAATAAPAVLRARLACSAPPHWLPRPRDAPAWPGWWGRGREPCGRQWRGLRGPGSVAEEGMACSRRLRTEGEVPTPKRTGKRECGKRSPAQPSAPGPEDAWPDGRLGLGRAGEMLHL